MDSSIASALMIALIGMTLLFLSLIFFYGLLSLLTAVIKDRPAPDRHNREGRSGDGEMETRPEEVLRAAAVAVALARAEAEERPGLIITPVPGAASAELAVSPWWSLHHQRQLGPHPSRRRSR